MLSGKLVESSIHEDVSIPFGGNSDQKIIIQLQALGLFFRYDINQKESTQFKKKIIWKFFKLSFKLALVLKSKLLWYTEANYLSAVAPFR